MDNCVTTKNMSARPRRTAAVAAAASIKDLMSSARKRKPSTSENEPAPKVAPTPTKAASRTTKRKISEVKPAKAVVVASTPKKIAGTKKRKVTTTTKTVTTPSLPSSTTTTLSGDLFTFGAQLVGELGPREKTFSDVRLKKCEPSRVKLPSKSKMVACGAYHTLVITETGELLSFGCNDDGPLGRLTTKPEGEEAKNGHKNGNDAASSGDDSDSDEEEDYEEKMCTKVLPVKGDLAGKVLVKVTAGDMHSAALDEAGCVYLWGNLK